MNIIEIKSLAEKIKANVENVIIGQGDVIELLITAIFVGGHVLLEDVPGMGKTVIAKALAKSIDVDFKRVQFTPDLLPSDLTGINYYNQQEGKFTFRKGPIFTNILLGDEINRATPRTQSSMLECMEERQVSVDGSTYNLDMPFLVIATQNPVETQGTFPLPEAQLDRFLMKISMGYPSVSDGKKIFKNFIENNPLETLNSVCTGNDIKEVFTALKKVYVSDEIQEYMLNIVEKTRNYDAIDLGVSPRGSLALLRTCQGYAAVHGRDFVTPEDVKYTVPYVFAHRIILRDSIRVRNVSSTQIISELISGVTVPTEEWKSKEV